MGDDRERKQPTRSIDITLNLPVSVEKVWKCLSDPNELAQWFPPDAEIEPGVGGYIQTKWPNGVEPVEPIRGWEPNRYLKTLWLDPNDPDEEHGLVLEYFLEPGRQGTTLRLVHSGFGEGEEWDQFYDGISRGWRFQMRSLHHYLSRHYGEERVFVWGMRPTDLNREEAWRRLAAAGGFGIDNALAELPAEGVGDYEMIDGDGARMTGKVQCIDAPCDFIATWNELNDGLLRIQVDLPIQPGDGAMVYLTASAYNIPQEDADKLGGRWAELLDRVLS